MLLPSRRKRQRSGIERAPRRVFQVRRAFVRRHECSIPNCPYRNDAIEFAHVGDVGSKGMRLKAPDWYGTSWCRTHHRYAHDHGHETMCRENGTTMEAQRKIALQFARVSPDKALRETLRLVNAEEMAGD